MEESDLTYFSWSKEWWSNDKTIIINSVTPNYHDILLNLVQWWLIISGHMLIWPQHGVCFLSYNAEFPEYEKGAVHDVSTSEHIYASFFTFSSLLRSIGLNMKSS